MYDGKGNEEVNIKMDLKEIGSENGRWMNMPQGEPLGSDVLNLRVL
jgi:hypothetical protein